MDQWWSERLCLQASTPTPVTEQPPTSHPCLHTALPVPVHNPSSPFLMPTHPSGPPVPHGFPRDSHGRSGQLWGPHPGAFFQPLAELLIDLHPRVWGGP